MACDRKIGPYPCCSVVQGDCLELMLEPSRTRDCGEIPLVCSLLDDCVLVTDPPYPNSSGLFIDSIGTAKSVLSLWGGEALVFWSELEIPPVGVTLVAVHIWKRTNVNGKIYEPIYHFAPDGRKRRSEVMDAAAVFAGVGPGCDQYEGHPTQKNVYVMQWLAGMTSGTILDPFCGSGTTLVAAKKLGRHFLGFEISPEYVAIARDRLARIDAQPNLFEPKPEQLQLGGE
jgi:hypothetical protein